MSASSPGADLVANYRIIDIIHNHFERYSLDSLHFHSNALQRFEIIQKASEKQINFEQLEASVLTLIQNMAWFDALSETLLSLVRDPECLLYILWNKIMIRDAHPFCSIVGRFLGKKLSRHDQSKRYPIMFANIN
eukprot:610340_1